MDAFQLLYVDTAVKFSFECQTTVPFLSHYRFNAIRDILLRRGLEIPTMMVWHPDSLESNRWEVLSCKVVACSVDIGLLFLDFKY
jgi:hypothetical protein